VQPVGGHGQRLDLAVQHRRERGVDHPGGGVEGEHVAPGDRRRRRGRVGDPGEQAAGDHLAADLDDGVDLVVEHVRGPVGRVGRDHRGLRHVDRGTGLRQEADQDRGGKERQHDTTTHERPIPPDTCFECETASCRSIGASAG
jgi:hypothetical protein